ncbi:hypothetical protein HBI56_177490 [Parastagonospora nodorum]|nr:hypothetical protein HBH53_244030 [Parastagonospora nodorum]KAH3957293.1 hypothetical protein HBH51_226930 [Parastagonospora nodorum]KAH3973174.1 hypothetical protein HBH52_147610 [Parastagonospora nodorum]KAH4004390.1 hypothetical protein HBI10_054550 [Parastagonospora nodorum]KAH4017090.1 hypothetical protein HBI13_147380 [Parastagonospora nodorum]
MEYMFIMHPKPESHLLQTRPFGTSCRSSRILPESIHKRLLTAPTANCQSARTTSSCTCTHPIKPKRCRLARLIWEGILHVLQQAHSLRYALHTGTITRCLICATLAQSLHRLC